MPVSIALRSLTHLASMSLWLGIFSAALPADASTAANHAPKIWGNPPRFAARDALYTFTPHATDADGDRLTFSIVNMPKWMWFDTRTGRLKGRPRWAQRNRAFPDIVIRVSDGRTTRALPAFTIKVGGTSGNSVPTITGAPQTSTTVGKRYYFKPLARDRNGDKLTFSILNKPAWARFVASTGELSGTPRTGDARVYRKITVRVSDGKAMASLKPFTLTVQPAGVSQAVTLLWQTPAQNTDGSALTDLAGYKVFYGRKSRDYSTSLRVQGATTNSLELQDMAAGTWYFAIKSVSQAGVESAFSGEVRAEL